MLFQGFDEDVTLDAVEVGNRARVCCEAIVAPVLQECIRYNLRDSWWLQVRASGLNEVSDEV